MLPTHPASPHPTLDLRLLTLRRLSISYLCIPKCSLRSTLYSKRSALFLIVFCESKVVKSMISDPHIWQTYPNAASQFPYMASIEPPKGLKIGIFQWRGGKSCKTASRRYHPQSCRSEAEIPLSAGRAVLRASHPLTHGRPVSVTGYKEAISYLDDPASMHPNSSPPAACHRALPSRLQPTSTL